MARATGDFTTPSNFELKKEGTIDARQYVQKFSDLLAFTGSDFIPNGFLVSVATDETIGGTLYPMGQYECIDKTDLSNIVSWRKVGNKSIFSGTYISPTVFNDGSGSPYTSAEDTIYIDTTANIPYYWGGTAYLPVGATSLLNISGSGGSFTLDAEPNQFIQVNNSAAQICTIPTEATLSIPIGTKKIIQRIGTGTVEIKAAVGVQTRGITDINGTYIMEEQFSFVTLIKEDTNRWAIQGISPKAFLYKRNLSSILNSTTLAAYNSDELGQKTEGTYQVAEKTQTGWLISKKNENEKIEGLLDFSDNTVWNPTTGELNLSKIAGADVAVVSTDFSSIGVASVLLVGSNPVVITVGDNLNGDNMIYLFKNGDSIIVDGVGAGTEIHTIASIDYVSGTFQLAGTDSTSYSPYTSGGTLQFTNGKFEPLVKLISGIPNTFEIELKVGQGITATLERTALGSATIDQTETSTGTDIVLSGRVTGSDWVKLRRDGIINLAYEIVTW